MLEFRIMTDLANHPFSNESIRQESEETPSQIGFEKYVLVVEHHLGHTIDGDDVGQTGCGYSLDECLVKWNGRVLSTDYVNEIRGRSRYKRP